jgi:prenyltransferase beta subunit
MRIPASLALLLFLPSASFVQTKEIQDQSNRKLETLKFLHASQDPTGGFFARPQDPKTDPVDAKPSLRATSAAVRALKYLLTGKPVKDAVPNADKIAAFVMSCYDPKTGGFADTPGGKPDVAVTAVGVMAAVELGIPKDKFAKAMDYLKENAKTFEEVRIGAAAVEAWGVKDCPFDLKEWLELARALEERGTTPRGEDPVRYAASVAALILRLGKELNPVGRPNMVKLMREGQRDDGAYGKADSKYSDLESTYRVMRALYLLKEKPKDYVKLRDFIEKCRNKDGGYGTMPGEKSSVNGIYFATIVTKWLDELAK